MIYKIISFQGNDKLIKEHDFSVSFIASQISTPKSHVGYLLNYHCKYQGTDYINLVKVLKSMRFIKAGYLEHKTIESLSLECGFNSRITFFNNFKKFNGISPKEFAKKVVTKTNGLFIFFMHIHKAFPSFLTLGLSLTICNKLMNFNPL